MEDLQRPLPPRSPVEHVRSWIAWVGYGRIVGSAIAMVIVCGGAYWLIRTPAPSTEASLPMATTSLPAPSPAVAADTAAVAPAGTGSVEPSGPSVVVVHVAGAVAAPGVYELAPDSRVTAAVAAAGGSLPGADPNALNLAAPVIDGTRIYVPMVGEVVSPSTSVYASGASGDDVTDSVAVDVNQASASQLEDLPGVGPATATAIVAERDRNGPFLSVDDLDRVPGIGPTKIEALRGLVTT